MNSIIDLFVKNGFIVALLATGIIVYFSSVLSDRLFAKKIPGSAIGIFMGLVFAHFAGVITGGSNGIADFTGLSGFAILGGAMFRDFTIVSTAMGADFSEIKKAGVVGVISLFLGVFLAFSSGALIAIAMGYSDAKSITTIGAGACTFIVGPVTGGALGASSEVIAISIAAGVFKSILVTIGTPLVAKSIGLNNPQTAMVYGGMMGTTSGVAAGLAATNPKLVPYGAITATFYTGLGCLLCPSLLYLLVRFFYD
ncbi:MAG: malonate transporter subunit MadM [Marivirga sp.]|nr:malonate transporter subunit MadM [Marivirga sp.]